MQIGPNDVPAPCARCGVVQLHRPGHDGQLACLWCMQAALAQPPPAPPAHVVLTNNGPTLGTQFRNAIVIVILFLVILAVWGKACSSGGH